MDYRFDDKIDVKLITLFIIDSFRMEASHTAIVDVIMLQPVINYFDLEQHLAELVDDGYATYYAENNDRYYSITSLGKETLGYFSKRIPKTVRERLLRSVKLKVKEIKQSIGVRAEYTQVNEIEYEVSLGISEGNSKLFDVSLAVGDKIMAERMCTEFKKDPQALYSEILSILIKDSSM